MRAVRKQLSYANLIATLALFLALGGAAYAATRLPKNSVGTNQLKKGAVTAVKISKKTRDQLRGQRGPQGPQGSQGKVGKTGAAGKAGATGKEGPSGTGPAFEVVGTEKALTPTGGAIVAENLAAGSYVITANVAITNGTAEPGLIVCTLNSGGKATATVGVTESVTLSLSGTRGLGGAAATTLTCSGPTGAVATYANVIAVQVKSQSQVAG